MSQPAPPLPLVARPYQPSSQSYLPAREPYSRRKIWPIALGTATGILLCLGLFVVAVSTGLRGSEATKTAVRMAQQDERVTSLTGAPLQTGLSLQGSIHVTTTGGHASLSIPVTGPRGKGRIFVEEDKIDGVWRPDVLSFRQDGKGVEDSILIVGNM